MKRVRSPYVITEQQLELILKNVGEDIDVSAEVSSIWQQASTLRGTLMPSSYKQVILPLFLIRRVEETLKDTREAVIAAYKQGCPPMVLTSVSGHCYYNTSDWTLKDLLVDSQNLAEHLRHYLSHFSDNIRGVLDVFSFDANIDILDRQGKLYPIIKSFSEIDFSPEKMPSIKAGYIFEHLLRKFNTEIMTGEHYTAREIIELMVALGLAEGMDDVLTQPGKIVSVMDLACGTGGMFSVSHTAINRVNPNAIFAMYGQELNPESWAICSIEMMLRGLDDADIRNGNSLMTDPFADKKPLLVFENPPFGVAWAGPESPLGSEEAVLAEVAKGERGRFPGGKPSGADSQMLFLQNAVRNLADNGRAVVVENSSPLVTGGTSSGESQIRRWLLENDYIEAIIKLPASLFYNTSLNTFLYVMSRNKSERRRGKVQLINAENIFHKLRKAMGDKRNELTYEDKLAIAKEYIRFEDTEISQIHDCQEFIYREYTVRQPLQRNYCLSEERVREMIDAGTLNSIFDPDKYGELCQAEKLTAAEEKKKAKFEENHDRYMAIMTELLCADDDTLYMSPDEFEPVFDEIMDNLPGGHKVSKPEKRKIMAGLSKMDKNAEVQVDPKTGEVILDDSTKDTEVVKGNEDVEEYMAREVLPYVPDAKWTFDEDLNKKNPVIRTGAEIPFERCFYVYETPEASSEIAKRIQELDSQVNQLMKELFKEGK